MRKTNPPITSGDNREYKGISQAESKCYKCNSLNRK